MHDAEEFSVINGVVLLCIGEFLGVEPYRASWARFFVAINYGGEVSLIEDCSSSNLRGIYFKLELS